MVYLYFISPGIPETAAKDFGILPEIPETVFKSFGTLS
jgi:hypothetical protein